MTNFINKKITLIGALTILMFTFTLDLASAYDTTMADEKCPKGDINEDCIIDLKEVINALQVISAYKDEQDSATPSELKKNPSDNQYNKEQENENEIPIDTTKIVEAISEFMHFFENSPLKDEGLAGFVKEIVNNKDIPCGKAFINSFYPFDATFHFNGDDECMGISGSVQIKSNIFDTKAYLVFKNITLDQYSVNGNAVASVSPVNCGYKAFVSSESLTVCGHELTGTMFAANNTQTNNELLVGIKGVDKFVYDNNQVKLEADITYTHKGGANGKAKGIINNDALTFEFQNFVIDIKRLMPTSGIMKMNGKVIDFGY